MRSRIRSTDGNAGRSDSGRRLIKTWRMDDWDPIARYQYEANTVFAHAPAEFKLTPWKLSWEDPCWVHADILLAPQTPATRKEFFASLSVPHRWDAFAKVSWEDQLEEAFEPYSSQLKGPHVDDWLIALLDCHQELEKHLHDTKSLFPEPFHFVARKEFATVDLPTILKEDPENLSVYLAYEKGAYNHYY